MMPARTARPDASRPKTLAPALAALALAGCALAPPAPPPKFLPASHLFTLSVQGSTGGCAVAATADSTDPARICDPFAKHCVLALRGEQIGFRAVGADFSVVFDPFGKHPHEVKDGKTESLVVAAEAFEPGSQPKTYTFYVTTSKPGCKPLDPKIIIQQ